MRIFRKNTTFASLNLELNHLKKKSRKNSWKNSGLKRLGHLSEIKTFRALPSYEWSLRMFDRFNRHRFQSLKLSKLIAYMGLHGWLKFCIRLPE